MQLPVTDSRMLLSQLPQSFTGSVFLSFSLITSGAAGQSDELTAASFTDLYAPLQLLPSLTLLARRYNFFPTITFKT